MLESKGLVFINADQIARNLNADDAEGHSYEAATAAMTLFKKFINEGRSFCYETVFSHPSKVEFISQAKAAGYEVILVYIHLVGDLHELRVMQRVSGGGHNVDRDKIRPRVKRTLQLVKAAAPLVDELLLFDNSSAEQPFLTIVHRKGDMLDTYVAPMPEWAVEILSLD